MILELNNFQIDVIMHILLILSTLVLCVATYIFKSEFLTNLLIKKTYDFLKSKNIGNLK